MKWFREFGAADLKMGRGAFEISPESEMYFHESLRCLQFLTSNVR
jgi:hypothetical protein